MSAWGFMGSEQDSGLLFLGGFSDSDASAEADSASHTDGKSGKVEATRRRDGRLRRKRTLCIWGLPAGSGLCRQQQWPNGWFTYRRRYYPTPTLPVTCFCVAIATLASIKKPRFESTKVKNCSEDKRYES